MTSCPPSHVLLASLSLIFSPCCLGISLTPSVTSPFSLATSRYYIFSPLMSCGRKSPITEPSDRKIKTAPVFRASYIHTEWGPQHQLLSSKCTCKHCLIVCGADMRNVQMQVWPDNIRHADDTRQRCCVCTTSEHVAAFYLSSLSCKSNIFKYSITSYALYIFYRI